MQAVCPRVCGSMEWGSESLPGEEKMFFVNMVMMMVMVRRSPLRREA